LQLLLDFQNNQTKENAKTNITAAAATQRAQHPACFVLFDK
jgi:hypothetical protein